MAEARNDRDERRRESRRFPGYGYGYDDERRAADARRAEGRRGRPDDERREFGEYPRRDFERRDFERRDFERREFGESPRRDFERRAFERDEWSDAGDEGGAFGWGARPGEELEQRADRDYGGDYARLEPRDEGPDGRRGDDRTMRGYRSDDRRQGYRSDREQYRRDFAGPDRQGSGRWDFGRSYGPEDRPRFGRRDDRYGTNRYLSGRDAGLYGYGRDTDFADLERWQREARRFEEAQRGQHAGKGPQGYRKSDARLQEQVSEVLTDAGDVDAREIEVTVADGEVTLSGTVEDRRTKRRAEDLAEGVAGVKDVLNQLKVKGRS